MAIDGVLSNRQQRVLGPVLVCRDTTGHAIEIALDGIRCNNLVGIETQARTYLPGYPIVRVALPHGLAHGIVGRYEVDAIVTIDGAARPRILRMVEAALPFGRNRQHDIAESRDRGRINGVGENELTVPVHFHRVEQIDAHREEVAASVPDEFDVDVVLNATVIGIRRFLLGMGTVRGVLPLKHVAPMQRRSDQVAPNRGDAREIDSWLGLELQGVLNRRRRATACPSVGFSDVVHRCQVVEHGIALLAHMAAHEPDGIDHLGIVLHTGATRRSCARRQNYVVLLAHDRGHVLDVLLRCTANEAGPRRCFGRVVVLSQQISLVTFLEFGVVGHVVHREALGVLGKELPIDDIARALVQLHHLVGDTVPKRCISSGTNRDPPRFKLSSTLVVARPHIDEFRSRFFRSRQISAGGVRGKHGIRGRENEIVGIYPILGVVAHVVSVKGQAPPTRIRLPCSTGNSVVDLHVTTHEVQNILNRAAHADKADGACGTIGFIYTFNLRGAEVERLIPTDALPFVFATHLAVRILSAARLPSLALHGILDAAGAVYPLSSDLVSVAAPQLAVAVILFKIVNDLPPHGDVVDHILARRTRERAALGARSALPTAPAF